MPSLDTNMALNKILADVKMLLGIKDNTQDGILTYHTSSTIQKVLNYCHREDLPEGLIPIVTEMVCKMYNAYTDDGRYGYETIEGVVSSITRGDFSVSYDTNGEAVANVKRLRADDFLLDYKAQLNAYRKVVMV